MHTRRRRGTAIIEYPQGILLVGMRGTDYLLPGGGVERGETTLIATVREVHEETGLVAHLALFLFEITTFANQHAVFWVRANGEPQPCGEIDSLAFYQEGSTHVVSAGTRTILTRFAAYRHAHADFFTALDAHDTTLRALDHR